MLVVLTNFRLFGQQELRNLSSLPDSLNHQLGVFLQIQSDNIVLINSSSDTINVYANTGLLWYDLYAVDGNGEWQTIDNRGGYCGVGFGYYTVPPHQYSWIEGGYKQLGRQSENSQSDHTTKIRVCMNIQNSVQICSEPKDAEIERWRFLPAHLYAYVINKKRLTGSALNEKYPNKTHYENQIALLLDAYGLKI